MKLLRSIFWSIKDLFLHIFPVHLNKQKYHFGFLIHPRDEKDITIKYPILKPLPKSVIRFFARWYWPVVVTKVTGLTSIQSGEKINGYILSIPLITTQILENRPLAVKRIRQAVILARKTGIKIIGLGALTASVTKGGEDLLDVDGVWITTGHAYTGYNVTRNLFTLEKRMGIDRSRDLVSIVGAAGSIGSISAELIARKGYKNLSLIDVDRKRARVEDLAKQLQKAYPGINIFTSYDVSSIKNADVIIAATNAPEALITSELVKPGAIVIDDAQPSDVAYEVLERPDVLTLEAGVVETPGITSNFPLGLKGTFDNFCCMAEVLILASHEWKSNFVIKRTTLEFVDKITAWGKPLHFEVARYQNRKELISDKKLDFVASLRKK